MKTIIIVIMFIFSYNNLYCKNHIEIFTSNDNAKIFTSIELANSFINRNRLIIKKLSIISEELSLPDNFLNLQNVYELEIEMNNINIDSFQMFDFKLLKILSFKNTNLKMIPNKIYSLSTLERLTISNCKLQKIDSLICNLINLSYINFSHNEIKSIDFSFNKFSKLENLDIGYNLLEKFPDGLLFLKNLWNLNIQNNRIHFIPEGLNVNSAIYASDNFIRKFPILGNRVQFIDLENNMIEEINSSNIGDFNFRIKNNPLSEGSKTFLLKMGYNIDDL